MSAQDTFERIRRIFIAFDASGASLAALESVTALAARLEAELVGLYIEDVNLLRLATLPFARAISAIFAKFQPLSSAEMERALRAQAALAEQTMVRVLAQRNVSWTFRTVRGRVAAELIAAAHEADLIALGLSGGMPPGVSRLGSTARVLLRGAPCPVLLTGEGGVLRPPVLVIYDDSAAGARALALATTLVRLEGGPLVVVVSGANTARLEEAAAARLAKQGVAARFRLVSRGSAVDLVRLVETENAGTLVLGDGSVHGEEKLQALLCRIRCPALLVSGDLP